MSKKNFKYYALGAVLSSACLLVLGAMVPADVVAENVTVEAGNVPPKADEFLLIPGKRALYAENMATINTRRLGTVPVDLRVDGITYLSSLTIADTVAPKSAESIFCFFKGEEITEEKFLKTAKDATAVSCKFIAKPDTDVPGRQKAVVLFTDAAGNSSRAEYDCRVLETLPEMYIEAGTVQAINPLSFIVNYTDAPTLSIAIPEEAAGLTNPGVYRVTVTSDKFSFYPTLTITDKTPPVISGVTPKQIVEGGTASYRGGVTVTDNGDLSPALSIDSTGVDLNTPGEYTVLYRATDESGNASVAGGIVMVVSADMMAVNGMADEILAEITTADMTQREKAHAIFNYVAQKVKYQSGNSPRELAEAATVCFTKGVGDCFVYNAGSQVLLNRVGIPNQVVSRYQGKTEHYWLAVNTGDGWYHFDASANNDVTQEERFMFTDAEAKEYTARIGRRYYEYDPTTVPDIVD